MLTLRAFSPDPLDPEYTISSRFSRKRSLLVLTIGGAGVHGYTARPRGKRWEIIPGEKVEGPYLTTSLLEQGRTMARTNHLVISFTPANLLCELEMGHLPDDNSLQKALLSNPKSVLRNRYEQDRRYQIVPSGDKKKFISFSVTSREAVAVEKVIKEVGMNIARMQIGLANMTNLAIRRLESARKDGTKKLILVGDQSVILGMAVRDGVWEDPFSFISRTSEGSSSDVESIIEYLESLAGEVDEPGVEFHLLHSRTCWWVEPVQKWFQKYASRFQLKRIEEQFPFVELQEALEG
ncbi:MAG: hypothetical protein ACOY3I_06685 [Verrucomicrobiota bacterium]